MKENIATAELEVMRVLWGAQRPLSFTEIRTQLEASTGWKKSTIQTLVSRLREKGAIFAENGHVMLYAPIILESEYLDGQKQGFIDRLFDGSAKNLVASLVSSGQLSRDDVNELQDFFKMEERDD